MDVLKRDAMRSAATEGPRALRGLLPDQHLGTIERVALDAARRLESDPVQRFVRHVQSDAGYKFIRQLESNPFWRARREIEERVRLSESLLPERRIINQMREFQELQRLSRVPDHIDRASFMEPPLPRPPLNLSVPRDRHVEAINRIERALHSMAQERAESVQTAIVDYIRQQQEGLREDQELVVYWEGTGERFRVTQFRLPNHYTVILEGFDCDGNRASRFVAMDNVEISSTVVTITSQRKARRIGFIEQYD